MSLMCQPTFALPVKLTIANRSSRTIFSASGIGQWQISKAPSGRPASANTSCSSRAVSGVCGAGFRTTALPTASAGATLCKTRFSGKLNGAIASTRPIG
ncbi:MAG: hypothetical protein LT106_05920 [Burkholderiaceae bacterium]|nr:hypothetical protein [Burkholderiaceae bacterium]